MRKYLKLDSSNNLILPQSNIIGYNRQRSINLRLNEVKVVGIKGKLDFDDEELYICFIDKYGKSNNVNSYFLNDSSVQILTDHFNFTTDYFDMPHKFYTTGDSFVFFPNEIKGKPLYKKWYSNLDSFLNRFYQLISVKYSSEGILTKEVKEYL
ncbi:MAG: hypothetical protein P1U56_16945 [Saprospiraceae bacterium]|nr:hypothetical protein [Saprospiraceae bacterium]